MQDDVDMAGELDARAWEAFELARRTRDAHQTGADAFAARNCDDCGHEIPAARRRAMPAARRCIGCATALEAK